MYLNILFLYKQDKMLTSVISELWVYDNSLIIFLFSKKSGSQKDYIVSGSASTSIILPLRRKLSPETTFLKN